MATMAGSETAVPFGDVANTNNDASSSGDGTTTDFDSASNAPGQEANNQTTATSSESSTLARDETTAVNRSKMLVLLILALAACGVSAGTYVFAQQAETKEFQGQVRQTQFSQMKPDPETISLANSNEPLSDPYSMYSSTTLQSRWRSLFTTKQ
jgi:uncharacterized protein HemX